MRRRRIAAGLEEPPEEENKRVRMTRKAAGEEEGWMNWKVSAVIIVEGDTEEVEKSGADQAQNRRAV